MKIVKGNAPSEFRSIGYYEGYQFKRDCLYQDASQVDHSKYTHLHFGFADISSDYKISINDKSTNYQFLNFKHISGPKRIISFGGWDFSTQADTYQILRQGTNAANRKKLATNIANFVNENNLDGVDIDWEYPSVCTALCEISLRGRKCDQLLTKTRHLIFLEPRLVTRVKETTISLSL